MVPAHVVLFSGGIGSWAAAKRVAAKHGTAELVLLFTDTAMEDEDLYRFLEQAAANVGGELVTLRDGRTPWQVFHDERYLGNHRIDPCSKILKRQLARRWINEHCEPEKTTIYLGIDWSEEHRFRRAWGRWQPFELEAPMCEPPLLEKLEMLEWAAREGLEPPRLYTLGFPHNNCGGFCVRAGHAHFKHLLETFPDRYAEHEEAEEDLRQYLGRDDVAILTDRSGGRSGARRRPMTLKEFRERVEAGRSAQVDLLEWGGCGCMVD